MFHIFRHIGFVLLFPGSKEKKLGWPYTRIGSKLCYCKMISTAGHELHEFDQNVKN